MDKYYFSYEQIHELIKQSTQEIIVSKFDPDYIIAIGTGGFVPARILKIFIDKPILTVTVSRYKDIGKAVESPVKHQWLDKDYSSIAGKKILLVDDVDDQRTTLEFCIRELLKENPSEIAVFVLFNKNKKKSADFPAEVKRIYTGKEIEDKWICFPWDAEDIIPHTRNCR